MTSQLWTFVVRRGPQMNSAVMVSAAMTILASTVAPVLASTDSSLSVQTDGIGGNEATRLRKVDSTLAQVGTVVQTVRNRLVAILQQSEPLIDPKLPQTIARLESEYASIKKPFDELEWQVAELREALEAKQEEKATDKTSDELRKQIARDEKERDRLAEAIAKLQERLGKNRNGRGRGVNRLARNMTPVNALIFKNRIVPVHEPYYKVELIWTGSGVARIITRVQDGEPVAQAFRPGGCLDSILAELADINPDKRYVKFFVCPDSVSAFRAAAKACKEQGLRVAWAPGQDEPFEYGGGGDWPE